MSDEIRDAVLEATEASLEAQLRAVRRLRSRTKDVKDDTEPSTSQLDMAYDILNRNAGKPLHVAQIIEAIGDRFGVIIDRESLVSSLSKKVTKGDRFVRSAPNTFGLREE